jgi:D-alanyl-D-alanine carboxypeptidase
MMRPMPTILDAIPSSPFVERRPVAILIRIALVAAALGGRPVTASAQASAAAPNLSPETRAAVDRAATRTIESMGVPSVSIAIVQDGRICYVQAYGDARVAAGSGSAVKARPEMRYGIGSISKQFTATALLMLAEDGKLSLDDKVARYRPDLTRAGDVTVRQLLSHTSGYQDYWPQDYVPPFMLREVTAAQILERWAAKPLDFEPGTRWQYSNTGFVLAGEIAEKAGGRSIVDLLRERVFVPLEMKSVLDIDRGRLTEADPVGYTRYALGPLRPAPKEGKGWLFAAGELAMTAEDLARWDVAMIEKRLLKPASYADMQTDVKLANGEGTGYGLGIGVGNMLGHRALSHSGGVSGFITRNVVFPDDRAAVVALTNSDSTDAAGVVARKIAAALFRTPDTAAATELRRIKTMLEGLQRGQVDRSQLSDNASAYFSAEALRDFASSLGPLGALDELEPSGREDRGGMVFRGYRAVFQKKSVDVSVRTLPDGKIEQLQVASVD